LPHTARSRFRGSKVLLKPEVQFHIVGIVEEEIELYIDVAGTLQQSSIQGVAFLFDHARVWDSD